MHSYASFFCPRRVRAAHCVTVRRKRNDFQMRRLAVFHRDFLSRVYGFYASVRFVRNVNMGVDWRHELINL